MNLKGEHIYIFLLILSFLIILPYISYVLFSLVLYGLTHPLYVRLLKYLKSKTFSAIVSLLFILFLFLSLSYFTIYSLYQEASKLVALSFKNLENLEFLQNYIPIITGKIIEFSYTLLTNLTKGILGYLLSFFTAFYLLVYSDKILEYINKFKQGSSYLSYIKSKFYGIVVGHIFFWGLQALLSYLGFIILGVKYSVMLSILVFIFAILPLLGPWTIWGILIGSYLYINDPYRALFSFVYGILFITILTEVLIKPQIVGKTANIEPLLVFLGIIGGLELFGPPGIFLGPIILELTKDSILKYLNKYLNTS